MTDGSTPDPGVRPTPDPDPHEDLDRRGFFRAFGRQTVHAAGSVAGTVDALRRGASAAAGELLRFGLGDADETAARLEEVEVERAAPSAPRVAGFDPRAAARPAPDRPAGSPMTPPPAADARPTPAAPAPPGGGFRAPYRLVDDTLYLLDQRAIPGTAPDIECRTASDVAAALRNLVVRLGPVVAQVGAYGVALTAGQLEAARYRRDSRLRSGVSSVRAGRPSSRLLQVAMDRMSTRAALVADAGDGRAVGAALRAEADAIATEANAAHAAIAGHVARALTDPSLFGVETPPDRPLAVVLHGNAGALAGGLVGTAIGAISRVAAAGQPIRAWITETRPSFDGARLTAWELDQADIPAAVVADSAVAWVLSRHRIDALLLGAEWIAANGDAANVVGSQTVAALCFRYRIPVIVCAPIATVDLAAASGDAIPTEMRPIDELLTVGGTRIAPPATRAANPLCDIVPGVIVSGFATEQGFVRGPYGETLRAAVRQPTPAETGPSPEGAIG